MFMSILGIQVSILGLAAVILGIISMILLIWKQNMTWYIWGLWILVAVLWFAHFMLFQDVAALIDTTISLMLAIAGLLALFKKKKRRRRKRK